MIIVAVPAERLISMAAADDCSVPLNMPVPLEALPYCGVTVRVTVVPTGIFAPVTAAATGLVVALGSVTSGVA
jgi:hypothetical protein